MSGRSAASALTSAAFSAHLVGTDCLMLSSTRSLVTRSSSMWQPAGRNPGAGTHRAHLCRPVFSIELGEVLKAEPVIVFGCPDQAQLAARIAHRGITLEEHVP
jgi:hypothetical protein